MFLVAPSYKTRNLTDEIITKEDYSRGYKNMLKAQTSMYNQSLVLEYKMVQIYQKSISQKLFENKLKPCPKYHLFLYQMFIMLYKVIMHLLANSLSSCIGNKTDNKEKVTHLIYVFGQFVFKVLSNINIYLTQYAFSHFGHTKEGRGEVGTNSFLLNLQQYFTFKSSFLSANFPNINLFLFSCI